MALTPLSEALERILATFEIKPDWEMVALEAALPLLRVPLTVRAVDELRRRVEHLELEAPTYCRAEIKKRSEQSRPSETPKNADFGA